VKVRIPENLDVPALILEYPITFSGFKLEKVYLVLSAIRDNMVKLSKKTFKHKRKYKPFFVPLRSDILIYYLGTEYYKDIIKWMITAGIIECDGIYGKGITSLGYKIADKYLAAEYITVEVKDKTLGKKSHKHLLSPDSERQLSETVLGLVARFNSNRLTIDAEGALKRIEGIYSKEKAKAILNTKGRDFELLKAAQKRNNFKLLVDYLANGEYPFSQDDNGRLHTVLTRLPKVLRGYVRIDNQAPVQVDMSNSQLFFTIYLLNQDNYNRAGKEKTNQFIWYGCTTASFSVYDTIMSSVCWKNGPQIPKPLLLFAYEAGGGLIYSKMVSALDRQEVFPKFTVAKKRKWVKDALLRQIYAEPESLKCRFSTRKSIMEVSKHRTLYKGKKGLLWQAFCQRYEMVTSVYALIRKDGYRMLSRVLQRIESHAIIECACKRILEQYPMVPLYTIHDCLVTSPEYVDLVQDIMLEEIALFIGYRPTVARTSWDEYLPTSLKKAV
jgi:hypothetical protein